jgi:hypothetical protein
MRNLHARLQRLEQRVQAAQGGHCTTVVGGGAGAPPSCPHGRPWSMVIHVLYSDTPSPASGRAGVVGARVRGKVSRTSPITDNMREPHPDGRFEAKVR